MKLFLRSSAVFLASMILTVHAEVYRCQQNGKLTYTDKPCTTDAQPAVLPPLTTVNPEQHPADLAKQYDRDAAAADAHARKAHVTSSNEYADRVATDNAVRKGVVEGRVVVGMTRDQVQRILNEPDRIDNKEGISERWIYINGRERRTVTFKNGLVVADASHNASWRRR